MHELRRARSLRPIEAGESYARQIDNLLESVFNLLYILETEASLSQKARQYLTLAEEEVQRVAQNAYPELNCSGHFAAACNVLCVDDDLASLNRRKVILEYKGYLVSVATTVTEALAIFRATDFGLVVTGQLPGPETAAMAREMKRLKPNVSIIMMSKTADSSEGVETVDAVISEQEVPESLIAKVDELAVHFRGAAASPALSKAASLPEQELPFSAHPENAPLLAGIVESSDDAIFSQTLEGTITSWNKAAENLYGYRAEEIIGKSAAFLQPSGSPVEVHDILQRLRNGEKVDRFEATRVAKDGHMLNVSQTISPIRGAGDRVIGASTIARETTRPTVAQKSSEESDSLGNAPLRNSEKLAAAGRMVAIVAHEIRDPLEATTDALYLLAESPSLDDSARQFLTIAQDELAEIAQITTATLGLHRGESPSPQPVQLSKLIDNVLTLYGRKLRNLGITVETRYDTDLAVNAFSGELRQVFSNIIVNAADALMKTGNKLCVHVTSSRDWANPSQTGLRVTIADDGPGIPAQELPQIFEPYYTTKGTQGTGIGLWLVHDIVRKHGGNIRVRSSVTQGHSGTTFCVFLPTAAAVQDEIAA